MASKSKPKVDDQKIDDQIVELLVKIFKPGGVTAGGAGAVWFLFWQSDIPKAIASAMIGLLLTYGAILLKPLHQLIQKRVELAGKDLERRAEQTFVRASGLRNKYLQSQVLAVQAERSEGIAQYEGIFTPMLAEVFVPLELDFSSIGPGFNSRLLAGVGPSMQEREHPHLDIWYLIKQAEKETTFRQLAILAWGGYGKTTLLKHIAYMYGTKQQPAEVPKLLPVLLVLRQYRDLLAQKDAPELIELICKYHIPKLPEGIDIEMPQEWLKHELKKGKVLILLDGFDEVGLDQRSQVARWINAQMQANPRSTFLLTSRPKAYRDLAPADRLNLKTQVWVREFQAEQRQAFVQRWYGCQERYAHGGRWEPDVEQVAQQAAQDLLKQVEAQQELKDLAKNPLLLSMIVRFHRRYPEAQLPKQRVRLYQEICQLQLRDRPGARQLETVLTECDAQAILQALAFEMMVQHWERIERGELLQRLQAALEHQDETTKAEKLLEQVVQISELIVEQEDEYEFAHLSFQEYLAAKYIADQPEERESLLYEHLGDDWWKSTILLCAALLKKPSRLIRAALQQGLKDLAYACWQETTKQIDAELADQLGAQGQSGQSEIVNDLQTLRQEVEDSRYQQLAAYLSNGEWQKADEETYRLMITTVGKEVGQGFTRDELLNFPCDALKAIDGLWVKYSRGKFGFSVQKDIYLNKCGGIADGNYNEKAFKNFCRENGWLVDGQYFKHITWSLDDARSGHLPCFGLDWILVGNSLLSHQDL